MTSRRVIREMIFSIVIVPLIMIIGILAYSYRDEIDEAGTRMGTRITKFLILGK